MSKVFIGLCVGSLLLVFYYEAKLRELIAKSAEIAVDIAKKFKGNDISIVSFPNGKYVDYVVFEAGGYSSSYAPIFSHNYYELAVGQNKHDTKILEEFLRRFYKSGAHSSIQHESWDVFQRKIS